MHGLDTTLTAHAAKFLYHENLDATGGGHFTVTLVIEVTTSDGFSGRETFSFGRTFGPGHSGIEHRHSETRIPSATAAAGG